MQEAKKSMKEKGIKAEDVKNLPPIEEIHGLNTPPLPKVVVATLSHWIEVSVLKCHPWIGTSDTHSTRGIIAEFNHTLITSSVS